MAPILYDPQYAPKGDGECVIETAENIWPRVCMAEPDIDVDEDAIYPYNTEEAQTKKSSHLITSTSLDNNSVVPQLRYDEHLKSILLNTSYGFGETRVLLEDGQSAGDFLWTKDESSADAKWENKTFSNGVGYIYQYNAHPATNTVLIMNRKNVGPGFAFWLHLMPMTNMSADVRASICFWGEWRISIYPFVTPRICLERVGSGTYQTVEQWTDPRLQNIQESGMPITISVEYLFNAMRICSNIAPLASDKQEVIFYNNKSDIDVSESSWKFETINTGQYGFAFTELEYFTSGSLISPWYYNEPTCPWRETTVYADRYDTGLAIEGTGMEAKKFTLYPGKGEPQVLIEDATIVDPPGEAVIVDKVVSSKIQAGANTDQYRYIATLSTVTGKYSPQLRAVQVNNGPTVQAITKSYVPVVPSHSLLSCSIDSNAQDQTATLTFDNRSGAFRSFSGVHCVAINVDIRLRGGITIGPYRRFTGYCYNPTWSRPDSTKSTFTLQCTGRKIMLENAMLFNAPIYDGWCFLRAARDLAMRGGFLDAEILAQQDPRTGVGQTLWDSMDSRCRNDTCEHRLPWADISGGGTFGSPRFKFGSGSFVWDCIEEMRKYLSEYWVYVNNWGNLIVRKGFVSDYVKTYNEVPQMGAYDEIMRLDMQAPTDHIRNAVAIVGLSEIDTNNAMPMILSRLKPTLEDATQPNYIPWYRWYYESNPGISDQRWADSISRATYMRLNRTRPTASWRGWGHPDVFMLDTATINETSNTTWLSALSHKNYRITGIREQISPPANYMMDMEAEWLDPYYSYDPAY